jgi:FlaA1/EpsC-like NDP-sugar epimerase
MFSRVNSLSRKYKRIISVLADIFFISIAYWGAYLVRLDVDIPIENIKNWMLLLILAPTSVFCFMRIGLYRAVLRFVSFRVFITITLGILFSTLALVILAFFFQIFLPRTVPIIYFSFSMLLIGAPRLIYRGLLHATKLSRIPVVIYGAGSTGRQLQQALYQGNEFYPVAYVDDDKSLQGYMLQGIAVVGPKQLDVLIERHDVEKILLAMPNCTRARRLEVIQNLEHLSCEILSVPSLAELVSGRAKINNLSEVSIDDLLGRESTSPIIELLEANIFGKNVMVTGAGGSIGSELCRQILRNKPQRLVLFELSEYALYSIENELKELCASERIVVELIPLLGSVQRQHRLESVMHYFQVNTIYHAAAYKHVPLVEYNVVEGIRNNVFGTLYAAQAAINTGVETFVLISSDKAVRPTNTMGTTKRLAELVLQALAKEQNITRFCMVRFGNVLGSSGSVVPLFRKQIQTGGPVTLTHPEITRYFMTISEASQLVIQAGAMSLGGDVFVLNMGEPIKIIDLARKMIRLSGLTVRDNNDPNGDIDICITGLRPGEKLYEELLIGENVLGTKHPQIMKANEVLLEWLELRNLLVELDLACHDFNHEKIRELLLKFPAAFAPTDDICDLVWKAKQILQKSTNRKYHSVNFL